jgi:DNA-binding cell septation regulator SpoVG
MKVKIINGPITDEVLHKCYDYILEEYRKEKSREEKEKEEDKKSTS